MTAYDGYGAISRVYDRLNAELDYRAWADFFEACFDRFLPTRPSLVLDLACGTGRMTAELARRGYDMIGADGSPDMLSVAMSASLSDEQTKPPLYILQDMRRFELYGTVGAVTCCLDSLNYLTGEGDLAACFACVHNYLDPGGLFLFDMNTPYRFTEVYGDRAYILEDELEDEDGNKSEIYCGWQNAYDPESKLCKFYLSLFEQGEDGSFWRSDEEQTERCYSLEEIKATLAGAGMELLGVWADFDFSPAKEDTERWYFAARAIK
ncbi:MAG: class I SAM-dependent methyltransferase [Clostridia bacterium]|nr:class I SAM-dependent methyltransferase [Clostridia bacterium]